MGKNKEMFTKIREEKVNQDNYIDYRHYFNLWSNQETQNTNYLGGDEDFIDGVDVRKNEKNYKPLDDSNEY